MTSLVQVSKPSLSAQLDDRETSRQTLTVVPATIHSLATLLYPPFFLFFPCRVFPARNSQRVSIEYALSPTKRTEIPDRCNDDDDDDVSPAPGNGTPLLPASLAPPRHRPVQRGHRSDIIFLSLFLSLSRATLLTSSATNDYTSAWNLRNHGSSALGWARVRLCRAPIRAKSTTDVGDDHRETI